MRVPLSWLSDFVSIDATPTQIAETLDRLGFEVESVEAPGAEISGVIAARIDAVLPHPNADRLQLADVTIGAGTIRVVCGAPNIAAGMIVPYAPSGATLPGGFSLERRKIRGVESDGMLCSARELGLGEDHSGILALPLDAELGSDVRALLGLDDVVFDLSITPNRPDAMSIVGIARELAAAFDVPLQIPEIPESPAVAAEAAGVRLAIEDPELCSGFVARVAEVEVGPSPEWMQQRLLRAGMRPINNVVDVTNYVLLEWGRPLHAFDLDRLGGAGLILRAGTAGEHITTLDGIDRELRATDAVVADWTGTPQAIAGVMGGSAAEVGPSTRRIVLESAYFSPAAIAATAKRLNLRSEASARFERGIDPRSLELGADRAAQLLEQVAKARPTEGHRAVIPAPAEPRVIELRVQRVNSLLGLTLTSDAVVRALVPLGFDCQRPSGAASDGENLATLTVTSPTWRPDIEREIDLIEEVARRVGLDTIPRTVPASRNPKRGLSAEQRTRRLIQDTMVGCGLNEAITLPLINPDQRGAAGWATDTVRVTNPLRAEESALRATLLPGLVDAAASNAAHGNPTCSFFELGHVFDTPTAESSPLPTESEHLAVLLTGSERNLPHAADRPVAASDAVAVLRDLMSALRVASWELVNGSATPGFEANSAAAVLVDGKPCGTVGTISPSALRAAGVVATAAGFEIDLATIERASRRSQQFVAFSRFPAARFDLAFVADREVASQRIESAIRTGLQPLEAEVTCFDVFAADDAAKERSLTFAIAIRASESTLGEAEIQTARSRAIASVLSECGGVLRA